MSTSTRAPRPLASIGAAVIGSGFIGTVHIEALRRLGVAVRGVLGTSQERAGHRARQLGLPRAYGSLDELLADETVDVVHVTSPNRYHHPQVKAILAAGKHAVCEKPLAMTSAESAELVVLAASSGLVSAVNFNIRFYPLNQHLAAQVAEGTLGEIRLITGLHVAEVMADLATFIPVRHEPTGPVETFSTGRSAATEPREMRTEDAATILLRFENGARGLVGVSQVSPGWKNSLRYEIDGSSGSAAWDSERADEIWYGHRDAPNEMLIRNPALMNAAGQAAASLPGGHAEGFADTFKALYRAVYADVAAGGPAARPGYPTFADGHDEMLIGDAIAESARSGRWVSVAR